MKHKLLALLCAAALAFGLAGCVLSTPDTVGSIGNVEISSGLYLLAQYNAYQSAANLASSDQDAANVKSFLKETITTDPDSGETATVSDYVADQTQKNLDLYAAVESRFDELGGQLTEAVRRKPYSVVLFDEVEKAHPDVFNILLQVLDDGRITDSQGRTVDFKNTVIILTSNLGSDIILNDLEQRRAEGSNELSEDARKQIDLLLKSKFRPEFLNRLDEIVYYKSLTKDEMRKIVDLQLDDLRHRMDEGKHLKLEVTTAAKDFIIDSAYDSVYGARPIKRFIQSRVETLIAKAIIKGDYNEGATLTVDYDGTALVLK